MRDKKKLLGIGTIMVALLVVLASAQWLLKRDGGKPELASTGSASPIPSASGSAAPTPTPVPTPTPTPEPPTETVDVALIGSEIEGMYLARAAADAGLTVKVIDPRDKVGGQVLQGEMLFLDETKDAAGRSLVQGLSKELFSGFLNAKIRKLPEFEAYYAKLAAGIPIESGIKLDKVEAAQGRTSGEQTIASVAYTDKTGARKRLKATYWVENSDFAALVSRLQAVRMPGLEAFYGQSNIEYMSAGFMMKFKHVDWNAFMSGINGLPDAERNKRFGCCTVSNSFAIGLTGVTSAYKPSNDRVFLRGLNAVNQRDGEVLINALLVYTVDPASDASVAEAMELGKKEMPRILDHFRKSYPGWSQAELNGFPSYPYIREYNHYETDYVLKVSDMLGGRMFYDNVSIAGYPLDLQGTSANKWGIEMGRPDKYGMPLRSFLLKGYDNVVMAGKNVGSSAIAYGSARIQPNTMMAAEAIGFLMGQLKGGKKLKELTEGDWPQLQADLLAKRQLKFTGVTGTNYIAGWTADEIRKLDTGEINYPAYAPKRKK